MTLVTFPALLGVEGGVRMEVNYHPPSTIQKNA